MGGSPERWRVRVRREVDMVRSLTFWRGISVPILFATLAFRVGRASRVIASS